MNSQDDSSSVVPHGQPLSSPVSLYAGAVCHDDGTFYDPGVPLPTPPGGNTGGLVTCRLDYLRFTVPSDVAASLCCAELLALCGLDALPLVVQHRRGGHAGWRCSAIVAPGGVVAWGGQADTACIEFSAGALGYLAALGLDVWGWAAYMLDLGCRVTRFDVALDDTAGYITLGRVQAADDAGGLVTRATERGLHASWKHGEDRIGWTYDVGARGSQKFVRVYDKAAEQKLSSEVVWWRLELELKGDRATPAFRLWRDSGWAVSCALGLIRSAVDFRVPSATDSNVSRWQLCDWWQALIGDVERVRVLVGSITRTIENVARWLHASVSGALAAFVDVYGMDAMRQLLMHGHDRMSGEHRRMVQMAVV